MQHSALPSGIDFPLCHHHVCHMHLLDPPGIGIRYKLPTLSSPHRRLHYFPLRVLGIYHWLLMPTLSAYSMCSEATLLSYYNSWLSNRGAHTKLKCRGLPPPLLQLHLLMLTPANLKPKLFTSATRTPTPAIATPTTKPSTPT